MTQRAPLRFSDAASGASSELRAAVCHARSDGPNAAQLERLIGAVSAQLPAASAQAPSTTAATTSAGLHGLRWLLLVAIGAGAALWASNALRPETPKVAKSHAMTAAPPRAVAAHVEAAPQPAALTPTPEAKREGDPLTVMPQSAGAPPRVHRAASQAPTTTATAGDPVAEIALLQQARRALPSAPDQALALTESHARLFRNGAFREEREALAIEALLALGRHAEARVRTRALLDRYPQSAYRRRLERLLATAGDVQEPAGSRSR